MHIRRPCGPRVEPIADVLARVAERPRDSGARPFNMQATLHHNPPVSRALGSLSSIFFDPQILEPRLREIAILRLAWDVQSEYEFGQHTLIGRTSGLSDSEILALTGPADLGTWSDSERSVIRMVDALYVDDCVDEETWRELQNGFSLATVIALIAVTGCYRMAAGLFNTLGIRLDDEVPGWPRPF